MFRIARAATFAAALFGAGFLFGATSPGFAQDLHRDPVATLNALAVPQVPLDAPESATPNATPRLKPAIVDVAQSADDVLAGDNPDYATLSAAVAAQDHAVDDRDLRCLAAGVFFESKGEPLAGQLAVAQTIINRSKSGRFASSICAVLTQRGQFSFVRGGTVPSAEGRAGWTTAVAVAKVAMRDLWDGAAEQALYFHARGRTPGWRAQKIAAIGNHIFYR
ncbi:Cell Wall Hydrolase [Sphingomonas guangdongensis]|uniref:Cell Wall Hydrolase n=1 Tax=Sphingomonas guangdongensis TaxID=1141890 RepID=A0A285QK05_9SPHN|nr:cell wall hydrolase [Sphingomonas guangdongensis]SOB80467.1 Cell Wall Hydrolase [Sphingomonas guangdongensis]